MRTKARLGASSGTKFSYVLLQDGMAAAVAEWTQLLLDEGGGGPRIFFEPFRNAGFERIEEAATLALSRSLRRCIQMLLDGSPA